MIDLPDALAFTIIGGGATISLVLTALVGHLWTRIAQLETRQHALWSAREADALVKRAQGDHIDHLEDHIRQGKGPPPPPRPSGV